MNAEVATDEKRRAMAEELAYEADVQETEYAEQLRDKLVDVLEVHLEGDEYAAIYRAIADLIMPVEKPEKTCLNIALGENHFECSECGCIMSLIAWSMEYALTIDGKSTEMPVRCPNCGALVVGSADGRCFSDERRREIAKALCRLEGKCVTLGDIEDAVGFKRSPGGDDEADVLDDALFLKYLARLVLPEGGGE